MADLMIAISLYNIWTESEIQIGFWGYGAIIYSISQSVYYICNWYYDIYSLFFLSYIINAAKSNVITTIGVIICNIGIVSVWTTALYVNSYVYTEAIPKDEINILWVGIGLIIVAFPLFEINKYLLAKIVMIGANKYDQEHQNEAAMYQFNIQENAQMVFGEFIVGR